MDSLFARVFDFFVIILTITVIGSRCAISRFSLLLKSTLKERASKSATNHHANVDSKLRERSSEK